MALVSKKNQNLVESQIGGATLSDVKASGNSPANLSKPTETKLNQTVYKKKSFFAGVLEELKMVKWPTLQYVVKWSLLMVVFTGCFSLLLGASDHVFQNGIKFVDCTSPRGKSRDVSSCSTDFAKGIFGINS
jgi:preprotein translocase SecE subunit